MDTYPGKHGRHPRDNEHFQMGKPALVSSIKMVLTMQIGVKQALGKIIVKFDTSRDDWSKGYEAFMCWIKANVEDKSILRWVFDNDVLFVSWQFSM
jgi:hypothetical protein